MGIKLSKGSEYSKCGFQVTSVQALSPGAKCGLKVNEDFIMKINGSRASIMDIEQIMNIVRVSLQHNA
jgi:hypothetical protein